MCQFSSSNAFSALKEINRKYILDDSVDVVETLKQQAVGTESSDSLPEWKKYLDQNEHTGEYTYTDPNDGTIYEWDAEKRGWIPKVCACNS